MKKGIYTLANDNVYDQLIALLNSIEANYGKDIPVCVIPYDDNIKLVKKEVSKRKNVSLFDDKESIKRWEEFATKIWDCHPAAKTKWREMGIKGVYRLGMHRKFCAFDGIFEKFIFLDADIIVLNSLDYIFDRLELGGLVTSDFQHKDASHVYDINSSRLFKVFSREKIRSEIFCAGFYASKKGLLSEKQKNFIISELSRGDAEILYANGPDQTLLNYLIMKLNIKNYNFVLELPENKRTGTCVVSKHFKEENHVLYDKGNRLSYLHYIGIPSQAFKKACSGRNIGFPYRDIFMYYRYLNQPEKMPKFKGKARPYEQKPTLIRRVLRKVRSII